MLSRRRHRQALSGEVVGGLVYVVSFTAGLCVLLPMVVLIVSGSRTGDMRDTLKWAMLGVSVTYNLVLSLLAFRYGRHTWPLMLLNLAIFTLLTCGLLSLALPYAD